MTNKSKTGLDTDLIGTLADLLHEKGLTEIEYETETLHVRVACQGAPVAAAPMAAVHHAAPGHAPAAGGDEGGADDYSGHPGAVVSPMVGVVYTAPEPGTPPFVKVGDTVSEGDTLMLIEAMKVFNPIKAAKSGRIARILIGNEDPVEYGEVLMIIE